jgi:hypothetical protein
MGAGCGVGDPDDDNLPAARLRNLACEGHVTARPGGPLLAGIEYRRLRTTYASGPASASHVNLAAGFEF